MVYYLRDSNKTIVDLEIYNDKYDNGEPCLEVSFSLMVEAYSNFLLNIKDKSAQRNFIDVINELSEIRGWVWEVSGVNDPYTEEKRDNVVKDIKNEMIKLAKRFDLEFVQD